MVSEQSPTLHIDPDNCVCLIVALGRYGTERQVHAGEVETDADKELIKVRKQILQSSTLRQIGNLYGRARDYVVSRSLPMTDYFRSGIYLLPLSLVDEVDNKMAQFRDEWQTLVDTFCTEYPGKIEEMRGKLNGLFNSSDYDSIETVRGSFRFSHNYITVSVPAKLPGSLYEREAANAAECALSMHESNERMLFTEAEGHVLYLIERLTDKEDGEKKVLRSSKIEDIVDFFIVLQDRNVAHDPTIARIAEKGKTLLRTLKLSEMRDNDYYRSYILEKLVELRGLFDEKPKRRTGRVLEGLDEDV